MEQLKLFQQNESFCTGCITIMIIIIIRNEPPEKKGVSRPVHWCLGAYVRLCVTLTRMFNTSGSATLFFPNFWILNDAIFMVAAGREKTARKTTSLAR